MRTASIRATTPLPTAAGSMSVHADAAHVGAARRTDNGPDLHPDDSVHDRIGGILEERELFGVDGTSEDKLIGAAA
jgi:hypothetical protein